MTVYATEQMKIIKVGSLISIYIHSIFVSSKLRRLTARIELVKYIITTPYEFLSFRKVLLKPSIEISSLKILKPKCDSVKLKISLSETRL